MHLNLMIETFVVKSPMIIPAEVVSYFAELVENVSKEGSLGPICTTKPPLSGKCVK